MAFVNLDKAAEFLESTRRKAVLNGALIYAVALIIAVLAFLFLREHVMIMIIIIFVAYLITQEMMISRIRMPFRECYKQEFLQPLLNSVNNNLQCSPEKEINTGEFIISNIFSKIPRFLSCKNLISGNVDGFETVCAEIIAREEVKSKNLHTHMYDDPNTSVMFNGIFVIVKKQEKEKEDRSDKCDLVIIPQCVKDINQNDMLEIKINSDLITLHSISGQSTKTMSFPNSICSDGKSKMSAGEYAVGVKSSEQFNTCDKGFEDVFTSYVKTGQGTKIINQIAFREMLLAFKKTWEGQVYFSFSESRSYLAITKSKSFFTPKIMKPLDRSTVEMVLKDYNSMLSAAEFAVALTKLTT